jgi:hypothetical protein
VTEPIVYTVSARRWARGWELHIIDAAGEEIGVTQTRRLSGARAMVRDYLEVDGRPAADDIHVVPELDAELRDRVNAARAAVRRAAEQQERAAAASRTAVEELKEAGLSGYEIAAVLEVSPQRVSQLLRRDVEEKTSRKTAVAKIPAQTDAATKSMRGTRRTAVTGRYVSAKSGSLGGRYVAAAKDGSARRATGSKKDAR